jgi:uncharacterized protein
MAEIIQVKVRPNQRVARLARNDDGTWDAWLSASPVEGKANDELIRLFARELRRPKRSIRIRQGATGRIKLLEIDE